MADPAPNAFLEFVRRQGRESRKGDKAPATMAEWNERRAKIKKSLESAWGGFPKEKCDLAPKSFGELTRDGYRVEKVAFQTRPEVWMTANLYIPDGASQSPTVLCVHGHWKHAKQEPVVQSRCIGLAKLGFVVLCVDAFGAGERAVGKALGEYHGEMTAATLWASGLPLSGLQVYENMRAVDFLGTRPECDIARLGITGASGGGNQTMYAGAYDERFRAVVPVCSVGTYQVYLGAACCMCEVVPGGITFTEEAGLLSMVAPRALMVVNATKDAVQFSIPEAAKSVAGATPVFELHGKPQNIKHATFESPHDYNQEMREAMYGWMTLHLKGEGDGSPIAEPAHKTEKPEDLRCYPGESRPDNWVTIPRFAKSRFLETIARKPTPDHKEYLESEITQMRDGLWVILGNEPDRAPLKLEVKEAADGASRSLEFDSEAMIRLPATHRVGVNKRWAIVVDLDGREKALSHPVVAAMAEAGWNLVAPEPRACGSLAVPGDKIGRAPDHNSAEWSMWIGRPLAGQWAHDVRRTLEATLNSIDSVPEEIALVGIGPATLAVMIAASKEPVARTLVLLDTLPTYAVDQAYENQRLGNMIPGVGPAVGDVQHLLSLAAPRKALIAGAIGPDAKPLGIDSIEENFAYASNAFKLAGAGGLTLLPKPEPAAVVEWLG